MRVLLTALQLYSRTVLWQLSYRHLMLELSLWEVDRFGCREIGLLSKVENEDRNEACRSENDRDQHERLSQR